MKVFESVTDWQQARKTIETSIGFVPTMGALHDGHFALIRAAQKQNQLVVVSIFLNPTQFDQASDLANYPQPLEQDLAALRHLGVDYVLVPNKDELYPDNYNYQVHEQQLSSKLCGAQRPGHFAGVLTVVLKLFHLVAPTYAYFGEKDYQQLELIRGLVTSFFLPIEIVAVATVRDNKGLALSSRNQRLSQTGVVKAQSFARALAEKQSLDDFCQQMKSENIEVDYVNDLASRRYAAVRIDNVRLIDNVEI